MIHIIFFKSFFRNLLKGFIVHPQISFLSRKKVSEIPSYIPHIDCISWFHHFHTSYQDWYQDIFLDDHTNFAEQFIHLISEQPSCDVVTCSLASSSILQVSCAKSVNPIKENVAINTNSYRVLFLILNMCYTFSFPMPPYYKRT